MSELQVSKNVSFGKSVFCRHQLKCCLFVVYNEIFKVDNTCSKPIYINLERMFILMELIRLTRVVFKIDHCSKLLGRPFPAYRPAC